MIDNLTLFLDFIDYVYEDYLIVDLDIILTY